MLKYLCKFSQGNSVQNQKNKLVHNCNTFYTHKIIQSRKSEQSQKIHKLFDIWTSFSDFLSHIKFPLHFSEMRDQIFIIIGIRVFLFEKKTGLRSLYIFVHSLLRSLKTAKSRLFLSSPAHIQFVPHTFFRTTWYAICFQNKKDVPVKHNEQIYITRRERKKLIQVKSLQFIGSIFFKKDPYNPGNKIPHSFHPHAHSTMKQWV